jgi:tRNA(Ile)-lysidine synthase
MNPFEKGVFSALSPLLPGVVYVAAVSGGADSISMLAALAELRGEKPFTLRCLHVEHGIRPGGESRGDAGFVREFCKKLAVPCKIVSIPPGKIAKTAKERGIGIEAAARLFRHAAWNREAGRIEGRSGSGVPREGGRKGGLPESVCGGGLKSARPVRVLVAHTRDDLLETLLMRFLRGSGPAGLAAMPRVKGRITRPLLGLSRKEVLAYLSLRGIPYRIDSTNADTAYLRNRVRLELIPLLDTLFPFWRKGALNLAETQRLAAQFIAAEVERRIPWEAGASANAGAVTGAVAAVVDASNSSLSVSDARFFAEPEIIREEALFRGVDLLAASAGSVAGRAALDPDPEKTGREIPRRESVRRFCRGVCRTCENSTKPDDLSGEGGLKALDLGPVRAETREGRVVLERRQAGGGERGFSLVVTKCGSYRLGELLVEVREAGAGDFAGNPSGGGQTAPGGSPGEAGFFASLPVALRPFNREDLVRSGFSEYTDSIRNKVCTVTAEDFRGIAACAGLNRGTAFVCARREGPRQAAPGDRYLVRLSRI